MSEFNTTNPYHKEFGLFKNITFILKAISKYSKLLLIMLPMGFFINAFQRYLWTFITKFVIDLISRDGNTKQLAILIGIFSISMLVLFILQTFYYNKQFVQCIIVRMKLVMEKNIKMMTMPFEYTEDPEVLDCNQKADNASNSNDSGVEGMEHEIIHFVEQLGVVIFGLVILGTMNPWIVLGMTILAIINFIISNRVSIYSKKYIWDPLALWWRKRWYMNHALADFSFAKDIRMYGLRPWLTDKFIELNKERYEVQRRSTRLWFWRGILSHILWLLSQGCVYAYLIFQLYNKSITIGNFTLYLTSSATFFECITSLLNSLNQMLQRSREVDDFRSFLEIAAENNENNLSRGGTACPATRGLPLGRTTLRPTPSSVDTPQRPVQIPVPELSCCEFEFQNVSFKYPRAERYALKNLNLKIKAGERLAVVGMNGAGKSTFIKLLLRLYDPTEGQILLNGVDIQTYDKNSYYKLFAPVFQEVNLFAFSLAENVSMQSPDDTDRAKVQKCIEDAGLSDKTSQFSNGLDTQLLKVIYDDGVDLSGGEKQKLALARALYKNSPVVVLDEPTSALDAIAESKLYQDFDKLIGGKTSIYISHRLSSTQFCNNVAMFKNGQMIEYGTHTELMEKGGEYAQMFHIQSQYYIEDDTLAPMEDSHE